MGVVLSCVNLKGGVGKTALAVNLAVYAGMKGLKTLLVDCDPQTNATFCLIPPAEWQKHAGEHGTLANVLGLRTHTSADGQSRRAADVIIRDVKDNLDLLPSHLELFAMDLDLASQNAREFILRRMLRPQLENYQLIVCDCPPNLTLPTRNALAMSSHFIVPVAPDFLAGIGVGLLLERVQEIAEGLEVNLKNVGIVISRHGLPAIHRESIVRTLRDRFKDLVFPGVITERVAISEAASRQCSVFETSDSNAKREFESVCEEALSRLGWSNDDEDS